MRQYLEVDELMVETRKVDEIAHLIHLPSDLSEAEKDSRIARALDLYESLEPSDGIEATLAVQMVGTHYAALECLRIAAVPKQNFGVKDMNLKHAQKLMALYLQQVAALNKHRGKGQQKVTVEHVHVHPGGQAVVGNLEMGQRGEKNLKHAEAIEHLQDVPEPVGTVKKKSSKSRRSN